MSNERIISIDYFRAIAIILIVAGHSYGLSYLHFNSNIEYAIMNLITGNTALFVFISGFMLHHIFYNRYNFKNFS